MTKKQNRIMTGLIIWAGLLIVVLYSPIGSPDLYSSTDNYYHENRSIVVNSGVIQNAPKSNYSSDNSSNELDIPQVSTLSKTNYSVGNYQTTTGPSYGSSYSSQSQNYQSNNSSKMGGLSNGGLGNGGNSFIASGSSRSSAGSSGVVMTNGITTLSLTTDLNNTTSRQSVANNITSISGTDPGGDPTGDPIPVGDGWELLLFFNICYATYKMRLFLFRHLHILSNKRNQ